MEDRSHQSAVARVLWTQRRIVKIQNVTRLCGSFGPRNCRLIEQLRFDLQLAVSQGDRKRLGLGEHQPQI